MANFDYVIVQCPKCGHVQDIISKGGECDYSRYHLRNAPDDVLWGLRNGSFSCANCCTPFEIITKFRPYTGEVIKDSEVNDG